MKWPLLTIIIDFEYRLAFDTMLTHFSPIFYIYTHWKRHKIKGKGGKEISGG